MKIRSCCFMVLLLLALLSLLFSCSPSDGLAINDPLYYKVIYTWNGTAWNQVQGGGVLAEVDPVFSASPAFGITAGNILGWTGHPPLTTGTHGVAGTIVGTSDAQSLTNKKITMSNNEPIYWNDTLGAPMEVFNIWLDNNLDILYNGTANIFIWGGSGTGKTLYLWPTGSTAVSTMKDSPTLDFIANYWDVTNHNWEARVIHDMRAAGAAPKSWLRFYINGLDVIRLEYDNGILKTYSDGTLDMTTHQINNVVDPALAQDAATKIYVDGRTTAADGEFYADGVGRNIITAVAGTYYQWLSGTVGSHALTTPVVGDNITVDAGGAGIYTGHFSVAYSTVSDDKVVHWAIFKNGVRQANISCETKAHLVTMTNSSSSGILSLAVGDKVDLRVTSNTDGETVTVNHANLNVVRVTP